jgi:peptide deformylase
LAVREIRLYGDPVLRTVCDEVVDFDAAKTLISDLIETTKLPGRAGVAAPQIGVPLRAFSYNVNGVVGYLINPVLVSVEGEKTLVEEGCLSVPGLWHQTPRFPKATAEGFDVDGNRVTVSGEGLLAQALQHECDHLDGKVYLDRLEQDERRVAMRRLRETDWFI